MRVALVGLLLCGLLPTPLTDWTAIVKPALKKVPRLEMLREGWDKPGVCAAVLFNKPDGYAVTAAHCVEKPEKEGITITVSGRHAEVMRVNRILDVAVVKYDPKGDEPMDLAESTPEVGSEVAIIGYPFGDGQLGPMFGHISQVLNQETKLIWVNSDIIPGDSGGALIDLQGRLIGLNSQIFYQGPSHMAACVPIETLKDFLKPYLPKPKP